MASTAEKLLAFKPSQIQVTADFSSMQDIIAGEYRIPLQIVVPDEFKVVNVPVYMNIIVNAPVDEVPVEPEVPVEDEEDTMVDTQDQPIVEE